MTAARDWFLVASTGAPAALRARASAFLAPREGAPDVAEALAAAASDALAAALARDGGRAAALDLLAADALVTLALKARAESDPAALAGYAARLREAAAR